MFQNQKYVTSGINSTLEPALQLMLWDAISRASMQVELDYLQVFHLSPANIGDDKVQKITHTQEQPPYKKESYLYCDEPITAKVFCIDDGDHSTMLLAEEY